jgi:hypothetical protein
MRVATGRSSTIAPGAGCDRYRLRAAGSASVAGFKRAMDVSILGGRSVTLPAGWAQRTLVSVLGGMDVDARAIPGPGAALTFVAVFGGADIKVAKGARVSLGGFSLLGGRRVETTPGEGPEINVRAFTVFGGLTITDRE